jgi:2',3'-cyclic-nucleotide 2'-phosphodiesterase (5'-nucleotidase family)
MMIARRALLALPALAMLPRRTRADTAFPGANLLLVALSDLHSAQERAPAALAAIDAALAANRGVPALIAVNGDVFERGNALALRSEGAADWAFLAALRARAPLVLNIGNHEMALIDDPAGVVARARALDLILVSNLGDARTGAPYAPARAELRLGGRRVVLVGIATDEAATYRAPARPLLNLPAPAAWAAANLPGLIEGADTAIVLSHAGVAADRAILPLLPDGALLLGGHEHLRFTHAAGATRYLHVGSWQRFIGLVPFGPAPAPHLVAVEPGGAEDAAQARLVAEVIAAHGRPEDREVMFTLPAPLPLPRAARLACAAVAAATGSAAGLLGHTGFGTGLPAGPVTRLDFDAFLRFDGGLFAGEVDAAALATMAPRLNQDEEVPLAARIGDFAYGGPSLNAGRIAANGWVRLNAARFLGVTPDFVAAPGLMLKPVVRAHLSRA